MAIYFGRDGHTNESLQVWAGIVGPFSVRIYKKDHHVVWVIARHDTGQEVEFGVSPSPREAARAAEDALRKRHLSGRSLVQAARVAWGDSPCASSALPT